MYCKFCGRQIADDSKFCEFCGNLVQNNHAAEEMGTPILKDVILPEEPENLEETVAFEPPTVPPEMSDEKEPETLEELEEIIPKQPAVPAKPKKKLSKKTLGALIGGGAGLVALIVLILVLVLHKPTVLLDVTEYVDFKISGYNGFGVATCEMDWTGLETEALGEYPTGTDSKSKKKQSEYREKIAILKSAIKLDFTKKENVSVGDVLKATVTVDTSAEEQLDVKFSGNKTVEYTVKEKDLNGSSAFDLIDEFLQVNFTGVSGSAKAVPAIKERKEEYRFTTYDGTEYIINATVTEAGAVQLRFVNAKDDTYEEIRLNVTLDKTEGISNGDSVTLKLEDNATKALMDYGLSLSKKEAAFKAEKLNVPAAKIADIDSATLSAWNVDCGKALRTCVLKNWARFIHAGNNVQTKTTVMENVKMSNAALIVGKEESKVYLIYQADISDDAIALDMGGTQTMFFAAEIDHIVLDSEGKLLSDRITLPKDTSIDLFKGAYQSYDQLQQELLMTTETVDTLK